MSSPGFCVFGSASFDAWRVLNEFHLRKNFKAEFRSKIREVITERPNLAPSNAQSPHGVHPAKCGYDDAWNTGTQFFSHDTAK